MYRNADTHLRASHVWTSLSRVRSFRWKFGREMACLLYLLRPSLERTCTSRMATSSTLASGTSRNCRYQTSSKVKMPSILKFWTSSTHLTSRPSPHFCYATTLLPCTTYPSSSNSARSRLALTSKVPDLASGLHLQQPRRSLSCILLRRHTSPLHLAFC